MSSEVRLAGCQSAPLASYLKALGVLRLVAEQADPDARGSWASDAFVVQSTLDAAGLVAFFLERYHPTPIVAPWNGGSGFFPKDNTSGIAAIADDPSPRFAPYRAVIEDCRRELSRRGLTEKPDKESKTELIAALRSTLPDVGLRWLDAAIVLSESRTQFPPLLGTGGNDGRLDFTNNQMQRLAELLLAGNASSGRLLHASLFGDATPGLDKGSAIGQFSPAAGGGANTTAGFDRDALVNPWDYVLMLEGTLVFATAVTRRDEAVGQGSPVFPFFVRATGAGYASAARADESESRDEMWLPLWSRPAGMRELGALFAEGRAKVNGHTARTAVDFARAIAGLGVDRGISAFERFGFHVRNGLSYFATPLGRWTVTRQKPADLLLEIDRWLDGVRGAANGKFAPASLRRAASELDAAILALCQRGGPQRVTHVLSAIGEVEAVGARSPKAREAIAPAPVLSPAWAGEADDRSPEYRLARAFASIGLREHLVPVRAAAPWQWLKDPDGRTVWSDADLVRNLHAVLLRREVDNGRPATPTMRSPVPVQWAALDDVAAFIAGETDDERLVALLRGLSLIAWAKVAPVAPAASSRLPPAAFSLLYLAHSRRPAPDLPLLATPGLVAKAAAGDLLEATARARRRLIGAGLVPICGPISLPAVEARRVAAALLFPIAPADCARLRAMVLRPAKETTPHAD
ncbi:MAG TPA: type I-U CRISPR-associated protein Csx17 [Kofleriaceae bacterium]|nr:type I-U CRISPR-associated protein Csx17 [Kofleriaceae bacterium]